MTSAGRKRKHPGPELAPLGGEVLGRANLSLPSQPQSGCCRVMGCQEPLTPGYHKKYRICLTHSTREQLCLDGKTTCRWCQQCGSFHNLEEFDANYRSCRRSLARHQERRKHRNLLYGTRGKKNKQARQRRPEQQARQDEQSSQQGEAQHKAQPQPQLPRLPSPAVSWLNGF
ncbi:squamosa promoter-binding 7 isoform X2 [Chlorella sorokiniana]|uniref:Squamosa promoter-binding 7 isoform X2 n=1 Tax=Chlorella sorokiniana TaxID=3076 RepID=A0A2P6TM26_CHLSO|nr:squamosa promoter-binding 7 isoform X2 [Chlorella sorokiniana]|eukprot:PRW45379.1 squamosa promoter-binding 7 isoform X2 [Chlorella sorokiniana]